MNLFLSVPKVILFGLAALTGLLLGGVGTKFSGNSPAASVYQDVPFGQEYHEAYPVGHTSEEANVRSIAVDSQSGVWIATATGILHKKQDQKTWDAVLPEADRGPAFCVATDSRSGIWMSTWNSVFRYANNRLEKMAGPTAPISQLCPTPEGIYALGPHGVWLYGQRGWQKKPYALARSIRNAVSDRQGGLWVATDVGLFHCTDRETRHYYQTDYLLSAYVRGLAWDNGQNLWAGGLGGVTLLQDAKKRQTLQPENGIPSNQVTCVERSPEGVMWVGTAMGIVRYQPDGHHSLRFSRRWLLDDTVNDLAFDADGTAWIATANGVSAIRKRSVTLAQKSDYFYDVLMKRHIRAPWISGQCRLPVPGDSSQWLPDDDDNDGEYTGNYLAMEAFRYAVTKSPDARQKAAKAFRFLKKLQEVTGTDGFFARTIIPTDWTEMHDGNCTFSDRQQADELVKEPRFKPVGVRWRKSVDGQWLWKGDTSSDEMCGHMMGYFFYYELAADEAEKGLIRTHVRKIVDYLMAHQYNFADTDGKPTRWGVWSPAQLNRDPEWTPERNQNSMELLAFLKLTYYLTSDEKYEREYRRLIDQEHYLDNMAGIPAQNPAWFIYFDVLLQAYIYPILLQCEKDPKLLAFYENQFDAWMEKNRSSRNPLINFLYAYSRHKTVDLDASVGFLVDTPLDLVDWTIDHTRREDVRTVHSPVLDELQINELPPASIRAVVRWDKNPWAAVSGNPGIEREPVFWLLPYWMGRYLKSID